MAEAFLKKAYRRNCAQFQTGDYEREGVEAQLSQRLY